MQVGEYATGNDAAGDEAIAKNEIIKGFLNQRTDALNPYGKTINELTRIVEA